MKTFKFIYTLSFIFFTSFIAFGQHQLEVDGSGRIFGDLQLSTTTPTLYLGGTPTDVGAIGYYDNTGPFLLPEAYLSYHSSSDIFTFSDGDNSYSNSSFSIDLSNPDIGSGTDGTLIIGNPTSFYLTMDNDGIQARGINSSTTSPMYVNGEGGNVILGLPSNSFSNVGIGAENPASKLHIKQTSNVDGIRIEHDDNTNYWETYVDNLDDYNFSYNGSLRAYIEDGAGSFVITSDGRLKNSVSPISNVLDGLMKLKPTTYFYNVDKNPDRKSWGFIAQEVAEVFPELVREKDGYKGLSYDDFGIMAIKAIQEQQIIINHQAELINAMEQRLVALENK